MGLKEIWQNSLNIAKGVIRRRTEFETESKGRAHILEGLKTVLDHIDEG